MLPLGLVLTLLSSIFLITAAIPAKRVCFLSICSSDISHSQRIDVMYTELLPTQLATFIPCLEQKSPVLKCLAQNPLHFNTGDFCARQGIKLFAQGFAPDQYGPSVLNKRPFCNAFSGCGSGKRYIGHHHPCRHHHQHYLHRHLPKSG